jgi:hypothetical protein
LSANNHRTEKDEPLSSEHVSPSRCCAPEGLISAVCRIHLIHFIEKLSLKLVLDPTPQPSHDSATLSLKGIVVHASTPFFVTPTGSDFLLRPSGSPNDFTAIYYVV